MKVLMVHKTYKGGVAVHVKEISEGLRRKGVEVSEITRNEDLGLTSFFTSYPKMKEVFKEWGRKYDIIHAHDWSIAYPAIKSGIKNLVATFHAFPTNFFASFFQNNCIKKLNERAIVVSPSMKRNYKNATYIPNGVNLNFFKKVKTIKRNKLLVGIGQNYNK